MRPIATLLLLPLMACSAGNAETGEAAEARGRGPSRTFDVSGFTGVELRGSDDVDVRVGPGFSVRAEGPADELDKLEVVRDGATLKVGRKRGLNWRDGEEVKVFVTMPRIEAAAVSGSGDLLVDRAQGARFRAALRGSGNLSVAAMRVEEAGLTLAGSGDLTGAGSARRATFELAGSGDIDARGLQAAEAKVSLAGSGDIRARVDGPAAVSLVGSGDVVLEGSPRCTINKVGTGDVTCR